MTTKTTAKNTLDAAIAAALRFAESDRHQQESAARAVLIDAPLTHAAVDRWLASHSGIVHRDTSGRRTHTSTDKSVAAARVALVATSLIRRVAKG